MANIETITVGSTTFNVATTPASDELSSTEKVIGTWIDGKPLYQKTESFTTNLSNSGNWNIQDAFKNLNIKIGYVVSGYINDDTNSLASIFRSDVNCNFISGRLNLYSSAASHYKNKPAVVTIQYTKTTD